MTDKLKSKTTAAQNQERICRETVQHPDKTFLSGPTYSEARMHLGQLGYGEEEIRKLENRN